MVLTENLELPFYPWITDITVITNKPDRCLCLHPMAITWWSRLGRIRLLRRRHLLRLLRLCPLCPLRATSASSTARLATPLAEASPLLPSTTQVTLSQKGTVAIWSTFDRPTDTLLPSQNLTVGKVLRSGFCKFEIAQFSASVNWDIIII